ncbi:restriction endonuclease subunit S [Bacillus thuringiensis]|nr:restriction endonuclease subunit S [Bacillus thuringiensis]
MSKNVPEVRFEGFSGGWRPINLSELMDFSNGINAPKESYGKGRKMISVMDILDKSYLKYENIKNSVEVSPSIEEKNKVEYGDLIFVRSSEVAEEVGWSKAYLEKEYALYSGFSIRGKKKGSFNPSFVELSLNYINRKQIERKSGGSTRFNISQTILNTIEILKASNEEQQKIGTFFKELDDMITLQQQLIEQQQQYKKAMLQKMFPQKGERVPKIRFDGFSGDWAEKKLEYFIQDYTEKTTILNQYPVLTSSQKYGIILQEEYFADRQVTTNNNIGYFVLPRGYFTFRSRSDNGVFKFNRNDLIDRGIISYFYPVFSIVNGDSNFFLMLLNSTIKRQVSLEAEGTGQRVLSLKKFKNIKVLIPPLGEQQKIGLFFKELDDTIALHQKKCEDYQQLKKGLLQRMFV